MNILKISASALLLSQTIFQSTFANNVMDPKFKSYEHENPGCPINSECSKESGKKLEAWLKVLEGASKDKIKTLNKFKNENGTPIQILARKEIFEKSDPILWNSRCSVHNPKNPNNTIYRGHLFLKDKLDHEVAKFTPVYLYNGTNKTAYHIPYGDTVSLIQNEKLIVLKDFEDNFFKIAIAKDHSYEFIDIPAKTMRTALAKKIKEIECPEKLEINEDYFERYYCQKVLDLDTMELRTIQVGWACP